MALSINFLMQKSKLYLAILNLAILIILISDLLSYGQTVPKLTVDKIMREPAQWMGTAPNNISWAENSKQVYFLWNPERAKSDSLYSVSTQSRKVRKVNDAARQDIPPVGGNYSKDRSMRVYERGGDVFILHAKTGQIQQVTNTLDRELSPEFTGDEKEVSFIKDGNLFLWNRGNGQLQQLTDFRRGRKPNNPEVSKDPQERFLQEQQVRLLQIIENKAEERKTQLKQQQSQQKNKPLPIYIDEKTVDNIILSPNKRFITYRLVTRPSNSKLAQVPNYVTSTGYTEQIPTRTKVGSVQTQ